MSFQEPHALEETVIYNSGVVRHYTCNPPAQKILDAHGIQAIGDTYNCRDPREMLLIPAKTYEKLGFSQSPKDITIVTESLLRKLGK